VHPGLLFQRPCQAPARVLETVGRPRNAFALTGVCGEGRILLDRRGLFQFVDVDGTTKTESLLLAHRIVQRRDKPSSQDVIVPLAKQLVGKGEKLLVFRNMRGPAQGCARYLWKELGLAPAAEVIAALPTQDLTGASRDLRECLQGGTAFHNITCSVRSAKRSSGDMATATAASTS
jgi:hypothetical protein